MAVQAGGKRAGLTEKGNTTDQLFNQLIFKLLLSKWRVKLEGIEPDSLRKVTQLISC